MVVVLAPCWCHRLLVSWFTVKVPGVASVGNFDLFTRFCLIVSRLFFLEALTSVFLMAYLCSHEHSPLWKCENSHAVKSDFRWHCKVKWNVKVGNKNKIFRIISSSKRALMVSWLSFRSEKELENYLLHYADIHSCISWNYGVLSGEGFQLADRGA